MAHKIDHLQSAHTDLSDQVIQLHPLLDDLENHSCRQNIWLRGIPETDAGGNAFASYRHL